MSYGNGWFQFTSKKGQEGEHREAQVHFKTFRYALWINPKMEMEWPYTRTIQVVREIFPMFELTLDGP